MGCGRCGVLRRHVAWRVRTAIGVMAAGVLMVVTVSAAHAGAWTMDPLAPLTGPQSQVSGDGILYTDACVPATDWCMALGVDDTYGLNRQVTLDEIYTNGTWTRAPGPPGFRHYIPTAEACPSTTYCMTIGSGSAAIWNGASWSAVRSPSVRVALQAVSCHATTCVATGVRGRLDTPVAVLWQNGVERRIAAPIAGLDPQSVYCGTASRCIAVGDYLCPESGRCPRPRPFAESWNGRRWSAMKGADTSRNAVDQLSCLSLRWCLGVGGHHVTRWNGREWTAVRSRPSSSSGLISCATTTSCEAVGSTTSPTDRNDTVATASHWDGQSWTSEPVPDGNAVDAQLRAVSCPSASFCTAVGDYGRDLQSPVAESWQG